MPDYKINWEIERDADTPQEAANEARRTQLDWQNMAYSFTVTDIVTGETFEVDAEIGK